MVADEGEEESYSREWKSGVEYSVGRLDNSVSMMRVRSEARIG